MAMPRYSLSIDSSSTREGVLASIGVIERVLRDLIISARDTALLLEGRRDEDEDEEENGDENVEFSPEAISSVHDFEQDISAAGAAMASLTHSLYVPRDVICLVVSF
jgi:hypothetical protein